MVQDSLDLQSFENFEQQQTDRINTDNIDSNSHQGISSITKASMDSLDIQLNQFADQQSSEVNRTKNLEQNSQTSLRSSNSSFQLETKLNELKQRLEQIKNVGHANKMDQPSKSMKQYEIEHNDGQIEKYNTDYCFSFSSENADQNSQIVLNQQQSQSTLAELNFNPKLDNKEYLIFKQQQYQNQASLVKSLDVFDLDNTLTFQANNDQELLSEQESNNQSRQSIDNTLNKLSNQQKKNQQLKSDLQSYVDSYKEQKDNSNFGNDVWKVIQQQVTTLIKNFRLKSNSFWNSGPHRYNQLPIAKFLEKNKIEDPNIQEQIEIVNKLDQMLQDKQLEEIIVDRETFPSKYQNLELINIEKHSQQLQDAIKKKRQAIDEEYRLKRLLGEFDYNEFNKFKALDQNGEAIVQRILLTPDNSQDQTPFDIDTTEKIQITLPSRKDISQKLNISEIDDRLNKVFLEEQILGKIQAQTKDKIDSVAKDILLKGQINNWDSISFESIEQSSTQNTQKRSSLGKSNSQVGSNSKSQSAYFQKSQRSSEKYSTKGNDPQAIQAQQSRFENDYIREERIRKELAQREKEVNQKIRQLMMTSVDYIASKANIHKLVQQVIRSVQVRAIIDEHSEQQSRSTPNLQQINTNVNRNQ